MGIACKPFKCHHFASLSNKTIYYSQSVYSQKKILNTILKHLWKKNLSLLRRCVYLYTMQDYEEIIKEIIFIPL